MKSCPGYIIKQKGTRFKSHYNRLLAVQGCLPCFNFIFNIFNILYLWDGSTSLENFIQRSPITKIALHKLVCNAATSGPEDVQTTLDVPMAIVVPREARGRRALEVCEGSRVEEEPCQVSLPAHPPLPQCSEKILPLVHHDHATPIPRPECLQLQALHETNPNTIISIVYIIAYIIIYVSSVSILLIEHCHTTLSRFHPCNSSSMKS